MNRVSKLSREVAVVAAFAAAPTYATQPGQTANPNGFPGGEHNNPNILGNNDSFACEQQYDNQGNPVYGNVFVPLKGNVILTRALFDCFHDRK